MIQARFLRLGDLLLLGLGRAAARDIPVYPPPAPLDTAGLGRTDSQTFANSQAVGMGPSMGLIVTYEQVPGNFSLRNTAACLTLASTYASYRPKNCCKSRAPPGMGLSHSLNYPKKTGPLVRRNILDEGISSDQRPSLFAR